MDEAGAYSVDEVIKGDTVREVLNYVQYNSEELLRSMRKTVEKGVKEQKLSIEEARLLLRFYEDGLDGYTYLE
ncbi:MAG: biosynthetic arginine decarboxylase [Phycisphaerales bacterium]|nr:biosynthetic arginine decarboxylase [Phycisphaerales bacterium]